MEEKQPYIVKNAAHVEMWVSYLMARRDALCRELSEIEAQLEKLGKPVKISKVKS